MREKIVAGNWKMNNDLRDGVDLTVEIHQKLKDQTNTKTKVILAPPYIHLAELGKLANDRNLFISAQNCATDEKGAFTGEISAKMIKSTGADYAIIGHSERRSYYDENSEILAKKVTQALENDLKVIFCCGENLEEREANKYKETVAKQLEEVVFKLSENEFSNVVIAYEPVWAIGTGRTASSEQAQEMHAYIRSIIKENFNEEIAENTSILYGGSCKPSNAKELFANIDVDGGLIGGASLKADDFLDIVNAF